MGRPQPGDYAPFYDTYISKIGDGSIAVILQDQQESTYQFLRSLPADKANYAYAEGKWTIKQVLGHMIDTERIMTYRAVCFARNDDSELPGFDENYFVTHSHHADLEMADLIEEFKLLRQANMYFFKSLNAEEKQRYGLANGKRVTVNGLLYIIAGHELHHLKIIKERYL